VYYTTKEKRIMSDLHRPLEAYEKRELTKVSWITGHSNLADCLTKMQHNQTLESLLHTNHVAKNMAGWVDRTTVPQPETMDEGHDQLRQKKKESNLKSYRGTWESRICLNQFKIELTDFLGTQLIKEPVAATL
jgi:hypothetical protein